MSTVKANDLTNVTGGIPTVKSQQLIPTAWVNFNGSGTVAIRDSEGVSSITDNGTGLYKVNFSTLMASSNYVSIAKATNDDGVASTQTGSHTFSETNAKFEIVVNNGSDAQARDRPVVSAIVMGGQA
jgi:hypothetical protein